MDETLKGSLKENCFLLIKSHILGCSGVLSYELFWSEVPKTWGKLTQQLPRMVAAGLVLVLEPSSWNTNTLCISCSKNLVVGTRSVSIQLIACLLPPSRVLCNVWVIGRILTCKATYYPAQLMPAAPIEWPDDRFHAIRANQSKPLPTSTRLPPSNNLSPAEQIGFTLMHDWPSANDMGWGKGGK